MYRLLIVDDERHVADALEALFLSRAEPELEVYKAYLAKDALDIFSKLKIDVLLSDIKMPEIDGFGLADRVRANWPDARIIFLTAYNDFELLYRTKKYQDISFLLKTEDEETIASAVAKAIGDIEERRRIKSLESSVGDMRALVLRRLKNDALQRLLKEPAEGARADDGAALQIRTDRDTALLCIRQGSADTQGLARERQFERLAALLSTLLGDKARCETASPQEGLYLALVQSGDACDDAHLMLFLRQMFDDIAESVSRLLDGGATLLLSDRMLSWNELPLRIAYMKQYLEESASPGQLGSGRIFSETDASYARQESDLQRWKTRFMDNVKAIRRELEGANFASALEALQPIRAAAERVKSMHHYPLIIIYQMIANALLDYVFSRDLIDRLSFSGGIYRLFSIDDFETWTDAFDYLEQIIGHVSAITGDIEKDGIRRFMAYIQEYVQAHLGDELSLTVLSERMNYNPSYISRLFKQASGRNLLEYINTARMEYAAGQLLRTNKPVSEIASEAGMTSAQYFATSFRKKYGQSPQEYRRHRKE